MCVRAVERILAALALRCELDDDGAGVISAPVKGVIPTHQRHGVTDLEVADVAAVRRTAGLAKSVEACGIAADLNIRNTVELPAGSGLQRIEREAESLRSEARGHRVLCQGIVSGMAEAHAIEEMYRIGI